VSQAYQSVSLICAITSVDQEIDPLAEKAPRIISLFAELCAINTYHVGTVRGDTYVSMSPQLPLKSSNDGSGFICDAPRLTGMNKGSTGCH
jgi:hypothetical protein